jgi:hypothetical protein
MDLITRMDGSDREVTVTVDFGENRDGTMLENLKSALIERGVPSGTVEDVIAGHAIANLKVYFRSGVKNGMKPSKTRLEPLPDSKIQSIVDQMVPTVPSERSPVVPKLVDFLVRTGKYSKEQADAISADPIMRAKVTAWLASLEVPEL